MLPVSSVVRERKQDLTSHRGLLNKTTNNERILGLKGYSEPEIACQDSRRTRLYLIGIVLLLDNSYSGQLKMNEWWMKEIRSGCGLECSNERHW